MLPWTTWHLEEAAVSNCSRQISLSNLLQRRQMSRVRDYRHRSRPSRESEDTETSIHCRRERSVLGRRRRGVAEPCNKAATVRSRRRSAQLLQSAAEIPSPYTPAFCCTDTQHTKDEYIAVHNALRRPLSRLWRL